MRSRPLSVLLGSLIAVAGVARFPVYAADTTAPSATQPQSDQLLPTDPANITGQFDNGLHYLVRKNANPPGKVAMYFAVRTGSLNETDAQNGLAHFLEHMAFKGSTHFAPTKLIPLLQHLGMQFGADTNAHTNYYETVYKLTMPDTKPQTLDLALTIFSDYATGLTLAPVQIDSERRVILEELRSRKGIGYRMGKLENAALFPGTRFTTHDVMGDPHIIETAPPELFEQYWNQWYRPENMTLVVVGDVDPTDVINRAKPLLGKFTARTPAQAPNTAGLKPFDHSQAVVFSDPEQQAGEVEMISLQPARPIAKTVGQYRRDIVDNLAAWIVDRRFKDAITAGKAPFRGADVGSEDLLHNAWIVSASAVGEPQDWKKMLDTLIVDVHTAIDRGFTQQELDLAKADTLSSAEWAAKTESTRDSTTLVADFTSAVDTDEVITSAAQDLELERELLPTITAADLQHAFANNYKTADYAYVLKLPEPKDGQQLPSPDDISTVAKDAWKKPTVAPEQSADSLALLPSEPTPGTVAKSETDKDLDLTTVTFDNGVVMHHKYSDYRKDTVMIQVVLPGGQIEETAANRGISQAASQLLARAATSRLTSNQIRDLAVGKKVGVSGAIGLDELTLSVGGAPHDLPFGMQLVYGLLTDGKLEQPALDEWKNRTLEALRAKPTNAEAQIGDAVAATIMGGDPRFTPLTPEIVNRQDRAAAEAWFKHIAEHAAIEVAVTGDISKDDAVALVAKYLGSLPKRTGTFDEFNSLRHLDRKPGPYAVDVPYQAAEPKAVVYAGFIGCDETDLIRRPLSLASLILTDRMIQKVRFEQQLVYGINCRSTPSRGMPGLGMITAAAPTDPKNAEKLADEILSMIKAFADTGPTADEVTTAKKEMANMLASQMKDPSFWLAQIGEIQYRHRSLEELKQLPDVFQTYTAEQLRDAIKKFATDAGTVRLVAVPASAATQPTTKAN